MKHLIPFLILFILTGCGYQQDDRKNSEQKEQQAPSDTMKNEPYQWPRDELVKEKLETWRDQKFGIIIHWGIYSEPGIIESWSICSEDWITRDSSISYCDYKKWYFGLKNEFNPVNFDPGQWAEAAKNAGMRYLVFTTKHHDGFCLWDTRQTDFKITDGPFGENPKADAAKYVFQAFRDRGFMIGAYFSKPDWHSPYYWTPTYATPDRNNNYDIRKHPEKWDQFKQYTYDQIQELMTGYGTIDILWLDGGWVRPRKTVNDEVLSWGAPIPEWSQDIDMPAIAKMARKKQPGILIVDRTVHGTYENYRTPEQHIPDTVLDYPWESCITLGNNWGYVPGDQMKSAETIIQNLIEITAKGGNMLLGVGPDSKGQLTPEQIDRLNTIGQWLEKNGEAIYATRPVEHFHEGPVFFTRSKDNKKWYALICPEENNPLPSTISWTGNTPAQGSEIILLSTGETLNWSQKGEKITIELPQNQTNSTQGIRAIALAFITAG